MAKSKAGRPPHKPTEQTRRMVEFMAASGRTCAEMAEMIGISERGMYRHYQDEMDNGRTKVEEAITMNLYQKAMDPSPQHNSVLIYFMKSRMGWHDKPNEDEKLRDHLNTILETHRPMTPEEWEAKHAKGD